MSLSRTMDRKGSKVLKVALSAALAAAFTPIAAAPAFAAAPTAQETTAIVGSALSYTYTDSFAYTGTRFVDGTTVICGYTPDEVAAQGGKAVMNDMARFLGGLYRCDGGTTVKALRYGGAKYVWDETAAGNLAGSNWVKDGSKAEDKATLVSAIVKDLADGLEKSKSASLQLGVSTDGSSYTNITLRAVVSTAQIIDKDGKVKDANATYSLAGALAASVAGDTVRMLSDTVTDQQLTLPAGVTLDGAGRTLTHLTNSTSDTNSRGAIQLKNDTFSGDDKDNQGSMIENLTIKGPNTTPAETDGKGNVTQRHEDEGEYAIKSSGVGAYLVVRNVTVDGAQTAMLASEGGWIDVVGSLRISNAELGGVEVSGSGTISGTNSVVSSILFLDPAASITYTETADTPFARTSGFGAISNETKTALAKVDESTGSETKASYYLNASDSKGAHYYTADALATSTGSAPAPTVVNLDGKNQYALLKFTPSAPGTYCFASSGVEADAAAELYSAAAGDKLGSKIASGDNEQGENFRVFAKLAAGTDYILKVSISPNAKEAQSAGDIHVTAAAADAASLDGYVVSLPPNTYYYSDENLTVASSKLATTVRSAVDGKTLSTSDYNKAIHKVNANGTINADATSEIGEAGRYALKVTSSKLSDEAFCYFDVKDAANIADYDFKYSKTLVFASSQVASIAALAPKGYRYGSSTAAFTESNLKFEGWYEVKDGEIAQAPLASAPSAVGSYVLRVSPINTGSGSTATAYDTSKTVDLPFSITRGRVSVPSARTGLSYTGSAQVGVPTGANYTLSGTYQATNAGTYSCTATLAEGYSWSDGTTAPKTLTWSIARARVSVPSGNSVSYTGKAQVGVSPGAGYTLSGTTSATEPGDYTCTATPTANYAWSDGTTASKSIKWTLAKAAAGITATPASVVVDRGGRATVALKQAGTASYTVSTSDATVATATVAGSGVSISANASGTATITVSTAATARYAAGSATISVSVPKAEGDTGSAKVTTVAADGTSTTVTNRYRVTSGAYAADPDATPTVAFTGTSAKSGRVAVPASVTLADGVTYKVTSVAARALKGKRVAAVELPASVTAIGKQAFASTPKLKSLVLGKKVKSVGKQALKGSAAKTVTLKTSKLSKVSVKNLLDGAKLTTVKCAGVSKKAKASYKKWVKTYKKGVKFK